MINHPVIKIFTTKMGITSSGFNFKNTLFNSKKRHIKSTTSQIKDQHILLTNTCSFLVKPVCNSSCSWLIDYSQDIQASNSTSILCSLTLGVIEVSRNGNNSVLHSRTKISLSNLTHLNKHHRGNFLGRKLFVLTLIVYHNHRLFTGTSDNLEWPMLQITLNRCIRNSPSNQTFCI
ncbi:hypothetical protein KIW84_035582 [Lathyrus oleraceus]|uniref:Uncharacterized protein n=1 Tax=Pisum sativum TaxID=3888 RepID=A0A9D4Y6H0_PEA|nr:hypothetical protein KIW84_035582 [Pisum sativum]